MYFKRNEKDTQRKRKNRVHFYLQWCKMGNILCSLKNKGDDIPEKQLTQYFQMFNENIENQNKKR